MQNTSTTNHKLRREERRPFDQLIDFSLITSASGENPEWLDLKGTGIDISKTGVGMRTDYPLRPNQVVWFQCEGEAKVGSVQWSTRTENSYRVGLAYEGTHVETLDTATELFNERLERIAERCLNPKENQEDLLKSIADAVSDMSTAYQQFEEGVEHKALIRKAQVRFREKTDRILSKSYFLKRARTWPKGYQGDYKMLEDLYRNTPLSHGIGYLLDMYFLGLPLNKAATTRIERLKELLREELTKRRQPSVLNIACGSCREVFELAGEIERSGAVLTCIDFDNDALAFAANRLSYTSISPVTSDHVVLRRYNALRMFDHDLNMSEFGRQDVIYSVGFFDYLPNDFLVKMIVALYRLLRPDGKLIAAFKDARGYRSIDRHWIVEWDGFLERREEDFREILSSAKIPDAAIEEKRDESGIIIFYILTK